MAKERGYTIDTTPIALLDVVHPYHPVASQRRDWVWLADANFSYSVACVTKREQAIIIRLMKPHRVGVDTPEFQVSISNFMPLQNARRLARSFISTWMAEMTGREGQLGKGRESHLLDSSWNMSNGIATPPVRPVQDRHSEHMVDRVIQDALPFDVERILRDAGKIRTYGYELPKKGSKSNLIYLQ